MKRKRFEYVRDLRKIVNFGEIGELCSVSYDFGHHSFFSTNKKRVEGKHVIRSRARKIVIKCNELGLPNYHDFDVLLGVLKLFEINRASIDEIGYLSQDYQFTQEIVKTIKVSGRDICYSVGNAYSQDALDDIITKIRRLCATEVYEYYNDNLVNNYRLLRDVVFDSHSTRTNSPSISLLMEPNTLDICTNSKKFLVRYRVLQTLSSLVQKGLYLFISSNKGKTLLESKMFKFLFRLEHPDSHKVKGGTSEASASDIIVQDKIANRTYAREMKKYNNAAREYRRQINDALEALKGQGIIYNFYYIDGRKKSPSTNQRLWIVEKNAPQS